MHTVGDSGAFQLGAQFLRMWRKNLKNVCIVSCQKGECCQFPPGVESPLLPSLSGRRKMVAVPSYARAFPVVVLPSVSHPHPALWCLCLAFHFHGPQLVGVCVPTEQYGLVFQDMGFTVYEYSIWNPEELCSDPDIFFDVMEVKGSPLGIFSLPRSRPLLSLGWPGFLVRTNLREYFPL